MSRYGDYSIFLLGLAPCTLAINVIPSLVLSFSHSRSHVGQARRCHCSPCFPRPTDTPVTLAPTSIPKPRPWEQRAEANREAGTPGFAHPSRGVPAVVKVQNPWQVTPALVDQVISIITPCYILSRR